MKKFILLIAFITTINYAETALPPEITKLNECLSNHTNKQFCYDKLLNADEKIKEEIDLYGICLTDMTADKRCKTLIDSEILDIVSSTKQCSEGNLTACDKLPKDISFALQEQFKATSNQIDPKTYYKELDEKVFSCLGSAHDDNDQPQTKTTIKCSEILPNYIYGKRSS